MTKEMTPVEVSEYFRQLRLKNKNARPMFKENPELARKAANIRWAKQKKAK